MKNLLSILSTICLISTSTITMVSCSTLINGDQIDANKDLDFSEGFTNLDIINIINSSNELSSTPNRTLLFDGAVGNLMGNIVLDYTTQKELRPTIPGYEIDKETTKNLLKVFKQTKDLKLIDDGSNSNNIFEERFYISNDEFADNTILSKFKITFARYNKNAKKFNTLFVGTFDLKIKEGANNKKSKFGFLNDMSTLHKKNIVSKLMEIQDPIEAKNDFIKFEMIQHYIVSDPKDVVAEKGTLIKDEKQVQSILSLFTNTQLVSLSRDATSASGKDFLYISYKKFTSQFKLLLIKEFERSASGYDEKDSKKINITYYEETIDVQIREAFKPMDMSLDTNVYKDGQGYDFAKKLSIIGEIDDEGVIKEINGGNSIGSRDNPNNNAIIKPDEASDFIFDNFNEVKKYFNIDKKEDFRKLFDEKDDSKERVEARFYSEKGLNNFSLYVYSVRKYSSDTEEKIMLFRTNSIISTIPIEKFEHVDNLQKIGAKLRTGTDPLKSDSSKEDLAKFKHDLRMAIYNFYLKGSSAIYPNSSKPSNLKPEYVIHPYYGTLYRNFNKETGKQREQYSFLDGLLPGEKISYNTSGPIENGGKLDENNLLELFKIPSDNWKDSDTDKNKNFFPSDGDKFWQFYIEGVKNTEDLNVYFGQVSPKSPNNVTKLMKLFASGDSSYNNLEWGNDNPDLGNIKINLKSETKEDKELDKRTLIDDVNLWKYIDKDGKEKNLFSNNSVNPNNWINDVIKDKISKYTEKDFEGWKVGEPNDEIRKKLGNAMGSEGLKINMLKPDAKRGSSGYFEDMYISQVKLDEVNSDDYMQVTVTLEAYDGDKEENPDYNNKISNIETNKKLFVSQKYKGSISFTFLTSKNRS